MIEHGGHLVGQPATVLAELVRTGQVKPTDVLCAHLDQIRALDGRIGAFERVRAARALAEAEALGARASLADVPLAGVPIAVKDNVPVAGEPMRLGSAATPDTPSPSDDECVRRLRAAGAIVVGITRMPELGVWGTTDNAFGITRNPWDRRRTPGGSSGGSAAAVAAALVPLGLGSDGLGSIRIPAAACGLVGIKPGAGVVPNRLGASAWFGMAEHGPLATTVADAALMLSVLADRRDLREPTPPDRMLRIAVSVRSPSPGAPVYRELQAAAIETGQVLARAGHRVEQADPPYPTRYALAVLARWFATPAQEAATLDQRKLEPRTRRHVRVGGMMQRLGRVQSADRESWRWLVARFFANYDLLLTPALATPAIAAGPWRGRSWLANVNANARYAPFAAPWNFAGYPAAAIPAGRHSVGMPLSVQLVAPDGSEALILGVAKQLETLRPWQRHAPIARVEC